LNETERTGDECFCGAKDSSQFAQANLNLTDKGEDVSFTRKLYAMTSMAMPNITARKFSRYCGKSEGYYGSITSQHLDISTNSLLYLSDVLEQRRANSPNRHISEIQKAIAQEVARRMQNIDTTNPEVRKMVLDVIANAYMSNVNGYTAPPVVIA
jgi:hypothetical protein